MKRPLVTQGPQIAPVGLGTWAMSGPWRFGWGPVDDEESAAAIRYAIDAGINWIDTAAIYGLGHGEEVIGRALAGLMPGEDVLLFTKCGRRWTQGADGVDIGFDLRPESIRFECEQSLRRLGVERIDLYQFHWPDYDTGTPVEESWGAMAELQDAGKVRWLGVCNFQLDLLQRIEAVRHVDSLQPPLSMLNRHARGELISWCAENGTGVIAYSPMASGLLTGGFDLSRVAEDDWRRRGAAFQEPSLSQALALVERLRPIAAGAGCTVATLAVAWTLAVPGVTGAIVGARRPSQVDGWLPAAGVELSAEDVAEIERAIAETGAGTDDPPQPPVSILGTPTTR